MNRPEIGITPSFTYTDNRIVEIHRGISRKITAREKVPFHWIKEYNRLIDIINLKDEYGKY